MGQGRHSFRGVSLSGTTSAIAGFA